MNINIRRFFNFFIDSFFIQILWAFALIIEHTIFDINVYPVADNLTTYFACFFIYYYILEVTFQRTVAKYITKTKVEFMSLNKKHLHIFIRTLMRFIPFEPFSIFFYKNGDMWHDKLSKTKVTLATKMIVSNN